MPQAQIESALSVLNMYGCTARVRQLRRGHLLVRSCRFCRGSSAWLLSSRFNHGRPNWADRFQLATSRRGRARCALWLNLRFSFHRPRSLRDNWAWRRRFRVRRGCCGWLRNRSVIFSLRSKRSCRAHLVKRGRDGFFFARLGFGSRGCRRFRRGLLRLRRRRCLLGSLRFRFMRNHYFLRMDQLADKENAAEQRLEKPLQHKAFS